MSVLAAPLLLAALLLVAWAWPRGLGVWQRWLLRLLRRPLARGTWSWWLAVGTFGAEATVGLVAGLPQPRVHDEFSYLLAADTFVRGRLANPTHALWRHFETFHVLLQPTYASKYPPGQGLALALGDRLGHPILGVWLTGALLVVAASWMLHGWLRPPWARLASLLLATSVVVATPWSQGYWGGFVAAFGGALVFGAAVRLREKATPSTAALLGTGLVLLIMTRPWEGCITAVVALAPLAARSAKRPSLRRAWPRRCALPLVLVVATGGAWLADYQWRVTGSPWTMPYRLYDQRYESTPVFLWQRPRAVEISPHPTLARFFRDFEGAEWRRQHTLAGWSRAALDKTGRLWVFYLGGALTVALAGVPWALRRRRPRWALVALLALLASQLTILPSRAHYVAPGACLVSYLATEGWRHLRLWRRSRARGTSRRRDGALWPGARVTAALPLALLLALPPRALALREDPGEWHLQRAALARRLAALPGRQLVLVRYGAGHDWLAEWVYDDADLAGTRVLWARAMTAAEDCRLVAYERDRRPWLLDVVDDVSAPRLSPYPACAAAPAVGAASLPKSSRLPSIRQGSKSSRRSAAG